MSPTDTRGGLREPPLPPHTHVGGVKVGVLLDGTVVSGVLPQSPAHRGGLREGDVIRSINKVPSLRSNVALQLRERGADGRIVVSALRGDTVVELTVVMDGPLPLGQIDKRDSGREIAL